MKKSGQWYFLDHEDDFDQLVDSLNIKGVREKKLSEALRRIRVSMKLKKAKKPSPVKEEAKVPEEDVEMKLDDEIQEIKPDQDSPMGEKEEKISEKHHMFDNDSYERVIIDAVWFNKTIPKKYGKSRTATRGQKANQQDN